MICNITFCMSYIMIVLDPPFFDKTIFFAIRGSKGRGGSKGGSIMHVKRGSEGGKETYG